MPSILDKVLTEDDMINAIYALEEELRCLKIERDMCVEAWKDMKRQCDNTVQQLHTTRGNAMRMLSDFNAHECKPTIARRSFFKRLFGG